MHLIEFFIAVAVCVGLAYCKTSSNGTLMEGVENFENATVDYMDYVTSPFLGIDIHGCDHGLRRRLENSCDIEYDKVTEEAQLEEELEKIKSLCCALEDYERCNIRAYSRANCASDSAAIKKSIKSANLFLGVIAGISCTGFRGRCESYTSAASPSSGFAVHCGLLISAIMAARFKYLP